MKIGKDDKICGKETIMEELYFGCGSGRDIKYFLSQNFKVDAIDGSEELCRIASDYTGIKVKKCCFKNLMK